MPICLPYMVIQHYKLLVLLWADFEERPYLWMCFIWYIWTTWLRREHCRSWINCPQAERACQTQFHTKGSNMRATSCLFNWCLWHEVTVPLSWLVTSVFGGNFSKVNTIWMHLSIFHCSITELLSLSYPLRALPVVCKSLLPLPKFGKKQSRCS